MAARPHPLDDFLPGVAAFFIADVRMFESRFVRNILIVVVVAKPRGAALQPNRVERFHAGGRAAMGAHARFEFPP